MCMILQCHYRWAIERQSWYNILICRDLWNLYSIRSYLINTSLSGWAWRSRCSLRANAATLRHAANDKYGKELILNNSRNREFYHFLSFQKNLNPFICASGWQRTEKLSMRPLLSKWTQSCIFSLTTAYSIGSATGCKIQLILFASVQSWTLRQQTCYKNFDSSGVSCCYSLFESFQ